MRGWIRKLSLQGNWLCRSQEFCFLFFFVSVSSMWSSTNDFSLVHLTKLDPLFATPSVQAPDWIRQVFFLYNQWIEFNLFQSGFWMETVDWIPIFFLSDMCQLPVRETCFVFLMTSGVWNHYVVLPRADSSPVYLTKVGQFVFHIIPVMQTE